MNKKSRQQLAFTCVNSIHNKQMIDADMYFSAYTLIAAYNKKMWTEPHSDRSLQRNQFHDMLPHLEAMACKHWYSFVHMHWYSFVLMHCAYGYSTKAHN